MRTNKKVESYSYRHSAGMTVGCSISLINDAPLITDYYNMQYMHAGQQANLSGIMQYDNYIICICRDEHDYTRVYSRVVFYKQEFLSVDTASDNVSQSQVVRCIESVFLF